MRNWPLTEAYFERTKWRTEEIQEASFLKNRIVKNEIVVGILLKKDLLLFPIAEQRCGR